MSTSASNPNDITSWTQSKNRDTIDKGLTYAIDSYEVDKEDDKGDRIVQRPRSWWRRKKVGHIIKKVAVG